MNINTSLKVGENSLHSFKAEKYLHFCAYNDSILGEHKTMSLLATKDRH